MMFNIRIVNLDVGSYLRMTLEKALAKAEKKNKNLYLQVFLERRMTFTHMVYSADGIPRAEALAAQRRLVALLSYKLKREYSEMCGFVRTRISLAIVRSNSLIHRVPCDKGAYIRQQHVGASSRKSSPRNGKGFSTVVGTPRDPLSSPTLFL